MSLEQAIEELKNDSDKAIEFIINSFETRVYNTVLGLVQNEFDAEEITQDVFIKVCKNNSSFKGDAAFSTWLYRIAVNESLQHLRKQKTKKRLQFFSLFDSKETEAIVDFVHPGVLMEQKENAAILFKAIKKLPEQQQVAFVLKNIELLKQQEIASIMQLNEGAVESLLQRAKKNLRKMMEGVG